MTALPTNPDAVLFDLDGTLVDTADEFAAIVQAMRVDRGLAHLDRTLIRGVVSNGAGALVTLALGCEVDDPAHEALRQEFLDRYETQLGQVAQPFPELRELIAALGEANIPWGVVTNKLRRFAEPLMAALEFNPAASVLITPCDVTTPKPDPEAILLGCRQVAARPEKSVYIGDHQRDIEAGNRAGCVTIAAAYGYLQDNDDSATWGADLIVHSSQELAAKVRQVLA